MSGNVRFFITLHKSNRNFAKRMKQFLIAAIVIVSMSSCHHDSLEDRAEKLTKDYTERYCPTPVQNMQRTDSITFDRSTHTFNYYYTLSGKADDAKVIAKNKGKLNKELLRQLKDNTSYKVFKEAGFNFHYVFRSQANGKVLLESNFTKKLYH